MSVWLLSKSFGVKITQISHLTAPWEASWLLAMHPIILLRPLCLNKMHSVQSMLFFYNEQAVARGSIETQKQLEHLMSERDSMDEFQHPLLNKM